MRNRTVARTTVLALVLLVALTVMAKRAWGTEAPGCGQQSLRPRLSQCCPRFLAGEWLPPKCTRAHATGFLAKCCGGPTPIVCPSGCYQGDVWEAGVGHYQACMCWPTPVPTPTPEPTCPEGWTCWPTPYPTSTYAIVEDKASCCAHVRALYTEARYAIVSRKREDLADLMAWRKQAMAQCREEYAR